MSDAQQKQEEYTAEELKNNNPQYKGFDYESPFQIELQKKVPPAMILIIILASLNIITGLLNDAFVPAVQDIALDYNVSPSHVQKLVSQFVIGMGLGQLFWGPFIDRFGRKSLALIVTILGIATNSLFVMVPENHDWSIQALGYIRVVQGVIFSGFAILPSVILKDVYSTRKFFILNSWLITIFLFAPGLAPLFGSWVLYQFHEWKIIFDIISIVVVVVGGIFFLTIPETLDPEKRQAFNTKRIIINYGVITANPKSFLIIATNCIISVLIFSFPALLPAIYIIDYGMDKTLFSFFPFVTILFVVLGVRLNQVFIKRGVSPVKLWTWGSRIQLISCLIHLVVAFQLFGITLTPYTIQFALVTAVVVNPFILGNSFGVYLMDYSNMTGTATSWLISTRLLVAGIVVNILSDLPREEGVTFLLSNVVIMVLVFLLTTIVVNKYLKNITDAKSDQESHQ